MKKLALIVLFCSPLLGQQITSHPGGKGSSAAIACVGTPGNTVGSYRQQCQTAAAAVYACNNVAGCALAADWVAVSGSGGPPTGTAGGALAGAYPNPTLPASSVATSLACTDTGAANALACINAGVTAYTAPLSLTVTPAHANTGATTLAVGALAALPVVDNQGNALTSGLIATGYPFTVRLNAGGTAWVGPLCWPNASGCAETGTHTVGSTVLLDSANYASFAAACTAAIAANATLLVSRSWTALTTQSCAANLMFYLATGALLQPASGQTLTLTGYFTAAPIQIFDLSAGGSVVAGNPSSGYEYPQYWGAKADERWVTDVVIVSGNAQVSSATLAPTSADVGKTTIIKSALGAPVATSTDYALHTTVSTIINGTTIQLVAAPSDSGSSKGMAIGTNDYAAVQAAITSSAVAGRPVFLLGHMLIDGAALVIPAGVRITGNTGSANAVDFVPVLPSSLLDLCYRTGAKVTLSAWGYVEIDHTGWMSSDQSGQPFFSVTQTTVSVHHNVFTGWRKNSSSNDMFIMGTTNPNYFQGYGSSIDHNQFYQIGSMVKFGQLANGINVSDNTVWKGSTGAVGTNAPFVFMLSSTARGNVVAHNLVEMTNYLYLAILSSGADGNILIGNGSWDSMGAGTYSILSNNNVIITAHDDPSIYSAFTLFGSFDPSNTIISPTLVHFPTLGVIPALNFAASTEGGCAAETDLVVNHTNGSKITSASYNFVAADKLLRITGGTGWTAGDYLIVSVAANAATLDRPPAAVDATGGAGIVNAGREVFVQGTTDSTKRFCGLTSGTWGWK